MLVFAANVLVEEFVDGAVSTLVDESFEVRRHGLVLLETRGRCEYLLDEGLKFGVAGQVGSVGCSPCCQSLMPCLYASEECVPWMFWDSSTLILGFLLLLCYGSVVVGVCEAFQFVGSSEWCRLEDV